MTAMADIFPQLPVRKIQLPLCFDVREIILSHLVSQARPDEPDESYESDESYDSDESGEFEEPEGPEEPEVFRQEYQRWRENCRALLSWARTCTEAWQDLWGNRTLCRLLHGTVPRMGGGDPELVRHVYQNPALYERQYRTLVDSRPGRSDCFRGNSIAVSSACRCVWPGALASSGEHIRRIRFDGMQLTQIPHEISRFTQLVEIFLYDNKLTEFPPELCLLSSLQWLQLNKNRLRTLPSDFGQLATNLNMLNLNDNQLQELPPAIGQLTALVTLDVKGNRLQTLPAEIFGLTQLRLLNLAENRLTRLAPDIGRLVNLEHLKLEHNPLNEVAQELSFLPRLRLTI